MNTTKLITGTLVGTVVSVLAGFLIFGLALSGYMAENMSSTDSPDMLWLVLGHLVFSLLVTYIFLQWAGIKTAAGGAKAGGIIGLLGALGSNWIWLAVSDLFPGGVAASVVDAIGGAIVWVIAGAAIGWVLGRGKS